MRALYFGHLMWRADSFEKTRMLGKIEGRRRRGRQRMRWLDGITNSMVMGLGKHLELLTIKIIVFLTYWEIAKWFSKVTPPFYIPTSSALGDQVALHLVHVWSCWFFSSVQSLSHLWFSATPWTAAHQASLPITNCRSLPKPMSIESVMPSNHLILCCPLLLLPSIFPSIRVFSNESALQIRWPKYWSFSFNISPSNEHPGLISFRMDWLDLLAIQGTLKSLLQHHSSEASFFSAQLFL